MIVVEASFRLPAGTLERARPHMKAAMTATRAEDGCLLYAFTQDIDDPRLIRVVECWRDEDALAAHTRTPHFKAWRAVAESLGVFDRQFNFYSAEKANIRI